MGALIDTTYKGCGHSRASLWDNLKVYWNNFVKLNGNVKKPSLIFNEVDSLKDGEVSKELFNHTFSNLNSSVENVYSNVNFEDRDYKLANSLVKNAAEFSIYKANYYTEILKGKTPEERSAVIAMYERHLEVEKNMATRSARSAKQWNEFERTSDLYPNLEYLPSRSVDKREEHQGFYGVIKPINDPFWDNHLPPNGWNCKCRVSKTDKEASGGEVKPLKMPNGIPGNSGKEQRIFTPNHPFISSVSEKGRKAMEIQLNRLKPTIPYGKDDYTKNSSSINVHPFAHTNDVDLNYENAKLIVNQIPNTKIKITPHVEKIDEYKNPEYLINGNIADLKTLYGKNIVSLLKSSIKQNCSIVVIKIENEVLFPDRLIQQVRGQLKTRKKHPINEVMIIDRENIVKRYKI